MRSFRTLLTLALAGIIAISLAPAAIASPDLNENKDLLQNVSFDAATVQLELETVWDGLNQPVHVTHAGDGSDRLFFSERPGVVRVVVDGELQSQPLLDISDIVRDEDGEQGFFSIEFHPDFESNGYFFAVYTKQPNGDDILARFQVSADNPNQADPASLTELITLQDQFANHNGGDIAFGPDGYLYYSPGDEGAAGDPKGNAQNPQTFFGKMLRIDVDNGEPYAIPPDNPFVDDPDVLDEIWAIGLRNPFRFSFDRGTGDLYIGDVGQNIWEEVNLQPAGSPGGENYGWPIMEGTHCYPETVSECDQSGLTLPILEYSHAGEPGERMGCSITGGTVYRGDESPFMDGVYIFGDWCEGRIWAGYQDSTGIWQMHQLLDTNIMMGSITEDQNGELYLTDIIEGTVQRLRFSQDSGPSTPTTPPDFADSEFFKTWARTDQPVANQNVSRTWIWGPAPNTEGLMEPYAQSPGGERLVQYFDKSRMEITQPDNDPASIWYVTNGLLVVELMTGQMQVGDAEFEPREPATINAAGDSTDPDGITYQALAGLLDAPIPPEDQAITALVSRDGTVTEAPNLAEYGATTGPLVEETGHRVASVFLDLMRSSGPVAGDDGVIDDMLFESQFFATGLPLTEAYWAMIDVGGTEKPVLIQAFERRVMTYTPDNEPGWQVEAGNVGQHYYAWRYGS